MTGSIAPQAISTAQMTCPSSACCCLLQREVDQLVKKLNHELLHPQFTKCPFSSSDGGCKLWGDSYPPAKIPSEKDFNPYDQFG